MTGNQNAAVGSAVSSEKSEGKGFYRQDYTTRMLYPYSHRLILFLVISSTNARSRYSIWLRCFVNYFHAVIFLLAPLTSYYLLFPFEFPSSVKFVFLPLSIFVNIRPRSPLAPLTVLPSLIFLPLPSFPPLLLNSGGCPNCPRVNSRFRDGRGGCAPSLPRIVQWITLIITDWFKFYLILVESPFKKIFKKIEFRNAKELHRHNKHV